MFKRWNRLDIQMETKVAWLSIIMHNIYNIDKKKVKNQSL